MVLAGTNGAGKSSILGAGLAEEGASFFNPDAYARELRLSSPSLSIEHANGRAWNAGRLLLETAIAERCDFAFETTLGGNTIPRLLVEAAREGLAVRIYFVGLSSPELHIARVASRVAQGGHDIPVGKIRERFDKSRSNLIRLLPDLTELQVFDNSFEADPLSAVPQPQLVLRYGEGSVSFPPEPGQSPEWAREIVAAAFQEAAASGRSSSPN